MSFDGEETVSVEIPIRLRSGFEAIFRWMKQPPSSVDWVEEETLDSNVAQKTVDIKSTGLRDRRMRKLNEAKSVAIVRETKAQASSMMRQHVASLGETLTGNGEPGN